MKVEPTPQVPELPLRVFEPKHAGNNGHDNHDSRSDFQTRFGRLTAETEDNRRYTITDVGSDNAHHLVGGVFIESPETAQVVHTAVLPYDPEFAKKIIAC